MKFLINKEDVAKQIQEALKDFSSQIAQLEKKVNDIIEENTSLKDVFSRFLHESETIKNLIHIQKSDFTTELEVFVHEMKENDNLNFVFEKIEKVDRQTEEYFKIVHNTISALSDIVLNIKAPILKTTPNNVNLSSYNKKLYDISERCTGLEEKLDVSIELILDKLADKLSEENVLPEQLLADRCPFKPKQGYCTLWANRKNKTDAMLYCTSCIQASNLLDKGIRL